MRANPSIKLRDIAVSVCAASQQGIGNTVRLAVVASSCTDLLSKLESVSSALSSGSSVAKNTAGVYFSPQSSTTGKLACLFSGQGSQYPGMLKDVSLHFPEVRVSVEAAHRTLSNWFPRALSTYIYPHSAFTTAESDAQMQALTDTSVAQPALGAVEAGLFHLLSRLGVKPDMAAGHSYGEYVALWAAGVWSDELLFEISAARGRFIKDSIGDTPGNMAAVSATREQVAEALAGTKNVWMANFNAPRQTIIAGAIDDLTDAMESLSKKGLGNRRIPVACAFHTPLMEKARERFGSFLAQKPFAAPRFPVYSNSTAAPYPQEPGAIAGLLREHLIRPVEFVREVEAMYDAGARVFLEIGPNRVLAGLARNILKGKDAVVIALDGADEHGITQLQNALAQMLTLGISVNVMELFRGRGAEVLPLSRLAEQPRREAQWLLNGGGVRMRGQAPR